MDKEQSLAQAGPEVDLYELRWRVYSFDLWRDRNPDAEKIFKPELWPEFETLHDMSFKALHFELQQRYDPKKPF